MLFKKIIIIVFVIHYASFFDVFFYILIFSVETDNKLLNTVHVLLAFSTSGDS